MTNGKKGPQHNAITHGVFAEVFSGSSEAEEFHKLVTAATEAFHPKNGLEEALVEKLVVQFVRLRRLYKADLEIAMKLLAQVADGLDSKSNGYGLILDEKDTSRKPTMDTLIRYETAISREIGRTLTQIQQLRQMVELEIAPISQGGQSSEPASPIVLQNPEPEP